MLKTIATLLAFSSFSLAHPQHQLDYVIVGGGISGLVVAEQLSQNPKVRIAVLEAGLDGTNEPLVNTPLFAPLLTETEYLWQFRSQPDPNLGGLTPFTRQGRALGGGSAVNYMAYCRSAASVYDEWAEISGNDGLRFDNLLADFNATTRYQEQDLTYGTHVNTSAYGRGPLEITSLSDDMDWTLQFTEAMKDTLGLPQVDLNTGVGLGVTSGPAAIKASNRTRSYALPAFGWRMANRPNVQIMHGAWVSKIHFADKRATGVRFHSSADNSTHDVHAKEVILAAGAISTPKLLLLSGVGPQNDLRNLSIPVVLDRPEIGSNLYNHHFSVMAYEAYPEVETLSKYMQNQTFSQLSNQSYARDASGILGQTDAPFAVARAPNDTVSGTQPCPTDRGQLLYQLVNGALLSGGPNVSTMSPFVALVQPQSTGHLRLNSSDYRIDPIIYSNYYGAPEDKAAMLHGYKELRRIMQHPSLAKVIKSEIYPGANVTSDADLWKAIQDTAQTFHHPLGTVAFGKVLDASWRIKGLQGIRVIDSSTLPTPPTCHIQASVYAVAHRAAQDIKRDDGC